MTSALPALIPLIGLLGMLAVRRAAPWPSRVALAALVLTLAAGLAAALTPAAAVHLTWGARLGLALHADGFGRVMVVLVPAIALPVMLYASAQRPPEGGSRLLAWLLGFTAAMEILVLADDFLALLIGWELVGACSWGLIGYAWHETERPRAAAQAFLTTRMGDLGLYIAAAAAFAATGSLAFADLTQAAPAARGVIAGGVLLAAAAKSAQVPFAPWLFSAMAGPTPASALLHSATMVAAGAYALIRLWPWIGAVPWLGPAVLTIGLVTAIAGGLVAAVHSDIKRALAGSTSSQYGLMFVALGAGSTTAAGAHLVTHAAFKALLFLGAGVAIHAVGTGELARMRLGSRLPVAAVLMAVGALALAAVPPLGGGLSKELIVAAVFRTSPALGALSLLAGGLTGFYAFRLLALAYGPDRNHRAVPAPHPSEVWALGALAAASLGLGLLWLPGGTRVVARWTGAPAPEGAPWELAAGLGMVAIAATLVWIARRTRRLATLGLADRYRTAAADWFRLPALARHGLARPLLTLARTLADLDDRVVDAGVRAAAWVGRHASDLFNRWGEWGADGAVEQLRAATVALADGSRDLDDQVVDGAVEGVAHGTGLAGLGARRLQTGHTHQYYLVIAAGTVVIILTAVWWR